MKKLKDLFLAYQWKIILVAWIGSILITGVTTYRVTNKLNKADQLTKTVSNMETRNEITNRRLGISDSEFINELRTDPRW